MYYRFKSWLWSAYPRNDGPLLRGERPRSIVLNTAETIEIRYRFAFPPPMVKMSNQIRARQRTFEAAYWRTALSQFSFAVIVLSIFQSVFYSIGGPFSQFLTIFER